MCAYTAMIDSTDGTIDHFLSWQNYPDLAFEWQNYRFSAEWINKSKKPAYDGRLLDPCEIGDDWFEVLLPSLEMVCTASIPAEYVERAEFTLSTLPLGDDERIRRQRQEWYQLFLSGGLALPGLQRVAPLIERAVRKRLGALGQAEIGAYTTDFQSFCAGEITMTGGRARAPALAQVIEAALRQHPVL